MGVTLFLLGMTVFAVVVKGQADDTSCADACGLLLFKWKL